MRIEAPWFIFYKATIFDTFLIRDSDCPLKRLLGVRTPRFLGVDGLNLSKFVRRILGFRYQVAHTGIQKRRN